MLRTRPRPPVPVPPGTHGLAHGPVAGEGDASREDSGRHGDVEAEVKQHVPAFPRDEDGAARARGTVGTWELLPGPEGATAPFGTNPGTWREAPTAWPWARGMAGGEDVQGHACTQAKDQDPGQHIPGGSSPCPTGLCHWTAFPVHLLLAFGTWGAPPAAHRDTAPSRAPRPPAQPPDHQQSPQPPAQPPHTPHPWWTM